MPGSIPRPPWARHPGLEDAAPSPAPASDAGNAPTNGPSSVMAGFPKLKPGEASIAAMVAYLAQIEHGRQAVVDALWARLPVYIDEYVNDPSNNGVQVDVKPQTRNTEKITALIAVVPTGAVGTLTLGRRIYQLPAGITQWGGLSLLLNPSDTRRLTATVAGNISLHLMGEQIPVYGRVN